MPEPSSLIANDVVVRRGRREVVSRVSVAVESGSILAVVGPNGAGKSTLLRALLGLQPSEGRIEVDGTPLEALDVRARARKLGYVPQQSRLASPLLVESVVAQGRLAHGHGSHALSARDREAVDATLDRVGLLGFRDRPFPSLSLGEQRRVLVARALATSARILLLDEPDAFLDVAQALSLFALLRSLRDEGYALLVVLHGLDEARKSTDRALVLVEGRTLASGPTRETLRADVVREAFGVDLVEGGALGFALPASGRAP